MSHLKPDFDPDLQPADASSGMPRGLNVSEFNRAFRKWEREKEIDLGPTSWGSRNRSSKSSSPVCDEGTELKKTV